MFLNDLKVVIKNELGVDLDNDYSRKSNVVDARNIFCDIAYDLNLFTFYEIGDSINRNHSTIIHACKRSRILKDVDSRYKEKFNKVFNNSIKPNVDESIMDHYKFYKRMYKKYKALVQEVNQYNKSNV